MMALEQASDALLIFGLLFIATWIEAMTEIEAAADWKAVSGCEPYCWLGLYSSWMYLAVSKRLHVLPRDGRTTKLLLATVCAIALTVVAQAKPVQQGLIDNKWVIEYDSELFAGACIATLKYDLLKLKISFITAYP
jgi:hypothetical protein